MKKFIAIEGLDGAGKSTQVSMLRQHLLSLGVRSEFLHFPRVDGKIWGELIAKFLRGDLGNIASVDPYIVALLYAEDRHDAAPAINAWLDAGSAVIVDRYVYSNIAFQCAKQRSSTAQDELRQWIWSLEYEHFNIPKPQQTLFLDVPFSFTEQKLREQRSGDDRAYLQGKSDIHEADLDFQQRVRSVYLAQQGDADFCAIPCYNKDGAMLQAEQIFEKIKAQLNL